MLSDYQHFSMKYVTTGIKSIHIKPINYNELKYKSKNDMDLDFLV